MQYEIYTNEKLRRVMVSLLCFLVLFLMANIVVQSIHQQEVYAFAGAGTLLFEKLTVEIVPFLIMLLGAIRKRRIKIMAAIGGTTNLSTMKLCGFCFCGFWT